MASLATPPQFLIPASSRPTRVSSVFVACPDARPPAYEAAAGFAAAGMLDRFGTSFYYRDATRFVALMRQWAPCHYARWRRVLRRRQHAGIPAGRVLSDWGFDLSLRLESRLSPRHPGLRNRLARARTERFDRRLAGWLAQRRPEVAFVFSDVASEVALPACRELSIPSVLSMVHGDVREERLVLEREAERAPDFVSIYLADGPIDRAELDWLHERRLRDLAQADRILVPSEHIAGWLVRNGTPADRVRVVPYAADTRRFVPLPDKILERDRCTFLFAGGITQRKGIKYLLEAWRRCAGRAGVCNCWAACRPIFLPWPRIATRSNGWAGWATPRCPRRWRRRTSSCFPRCSRGSAVVTYEALACGLPLVTTPAAGSVARDGIEGRLVPAGEVAPLAAAMEELGRDPERRAVLSRAARTRAEAFDWPRYHAALIETVQSLTDR